MNTSHIAPSERALPLLDVSPMLEYGSPTPLSTHWMPLHELLAHWMDSEFLLLQPTPVAPLLVAVGHALFALGRETRALRLHTQAGHSEQDCAPAALIQRSMQQAVRHLQEAAHHWSRAAFALDTLLPSDLDASALARARQLSRIARTQQERLWALTEEVQRGGSRPASGLQQSAEARCPHER
ncbi:MAG TPA: hypothetical protein VIZ18_14075 [Ktedonobacteraceae bacterium]